MSVMKINDVMDNIDCTKYQVYLHDFHHGHNIARQVFMKYNPAPCTTMGELPVLSNRQITGYIE